MNKKIEEIHPLWRELIEYVKNKGPHLRLDIRFKDGIPIEAENLKEDIKFGSDSLDKVKKKIIR